MKPIGHFLVVIDHMLKENIRINRLETLARLDILLARGFHNQI